MARSLIAFLRRSGRGQFLGRVNSAPTGGLAGAERRVGRDSCRGLRDDGSVTQQKQVIAPRSEASIRLALLAGYNADLGEALHALNIAGHMAISDVNADRSMVNPLVTTAIVAYGRCFSSSNVRDRLNTIIDVPDEHKPAHESMMKLRNSTIAHSESALMPSFAVVNLERDENAERAARITARTALALTSHPNYAPQAIDDFQTAVSAIKNVLLREIEVAKAALLAHLAQLQPADLEVLWTDGEQPEFVEISYDEWNIRKKRPKYPTSNRIEVVVPVAETRRTFLVGSSGHLFDSIDAADGSNVIDSTAPDV